MKLKDLIDELNTKGIDTGKLQTVYNNTNSTFEINGWVPATVEGVMTSLETVSMLIRCGLRRL